MPRSNSTSEVFAAIDSLGSEGVIALIDGVPSAWSGEHWEMGANAVERRLVERVEGCSSALRSEGLAYMRLSDSVEHAAARRSHISFANTTYDIMTGDTAPEEREMFLGVHVPVCYSPDAESMLVDDAFARWGNRNDLLLIAASAMTAIAAGKIFLLVGHGGEGKTTFVEMLRALIGARNCAAVPISALAGRFGTSALLGKSLCIGNDLPPADIPAEALKVAGSVATGDLISYEFKYATAADFKPFATPVYTCNYPLPQFRDRSGGFARRLAVIEFEAGSRVHDANILARFANDAGAKMALAAEAAHALTEAGGSLASVGETKAKARVWRSSNSVAAWLDETEVDLDGIARSLAYEKYAKWASSSNIEPVNRIGFGELACDSSELRVVKRNGQYVFQQGPERQREANNQDFILLLGEEKRESKFADKRALERREQQRAASQKKRALEIIERQKREKEELR